MNRTVPAALALLFGLTLAGCASDSTGDSVAASESAMAKEPSASAMAKDEPTAMAKDDEEMESEDAAMATQGAWINQAAYDADPAMFHESGDVVLFFSASWCPTCQASIKSLDQDGVPAGLTVVKVDFDTAAELRKEYGVTVQHTYVQVDESGEQLAKWTGSVSGADIADQTV